MKRLFITYGLLIIAGVFSFLFALNARTAVMMIYRTVSTDPMLLGGSILNAVTVILLMLLWVFYIFYLQHALENKCREAKDYLRIGLIFILPMAVFYAASEIIILRAAGL
jgi:hypothetical protein